MFENIESALDTIFVKARKLPKEDFQIVVDGLQFLGNKFAEVNAIADELIDHGLLDNKYGLILGDRMLIKSGVRQYKFGWKTRLVLDGKYRQRQLQEMRDTVAEYGGCDDLCVYCEKQKCSCDEDRDFFYER